MPRPVRVKILTSFSIAHCGRISSRDAAYDVLDGTRLLDRHQFQILFPDAEISAEKLVGFTKSLIAVRRA
jgi:hypothetical protein